MRQFFILSILILGMATAVRAEEKKHPAGRWYLTNEPDVSEDFLNSYTGTASSETWRQWRVIHGPFAWARVLENNKSAILTVEGWHCVEFTEWRSTSPQWNHDNCCLREEGYRSDNIVVWRYPKKKVYK